MSYGEYIEVVKTRNECQLIAYLLPLSNVATEVFVPVKFLLVSFETYNALVVVWSGRAEHAPRNVTRHELRLSAYPRDPMTPHP